MKVDPAFRYPSVTSAFSDRPVRAEQETERKQPKAEHAASSIKLQQVEQAVKEINDHLQLIRRNLEFSVDKDTQRVVVKVIDAETGEVVRQIPPDAVLELAKFLREKEKGNDGVLLAQHA